MRYNKGERPYMSYRYNQLKEQYKNSDVKEDDQHFVLWSGGCDSSLLLYELLDTYGSKNVVAVSYRYPWLSEDKYKSEQMHRNAFIDKLKLRGERFTDFEHVEFNIKIDTLFHNQHVQGGGLPQAIAWLLSIPFYVPNGSFIYTAIVKGDDLPFELNEYSNIVNGISALLMRDLRFRLPYIYLSKANVLEKLLHYELYEETWYCENPPSINELCHKCHPCDVHLGALIHLSITSEDELIKLKARKEIQRIDDLLKAKNNSDSTSTNTVTDEILPSLK